MQSMRPTVFGKIAHQLIKITSVSLTIQGSRALELLDGLMVLNL
jgi:hypothetical protein